MDETRGKFVLKAPYQPSGDQPQAIEALTKGVNAGMKGQVLLGVTGSGKTFTMASVIAQVQRPTLVIAHNKTLAAQLCSEFRAFFPDSAVEYFVSYYDYYQPEAYIASSDTYIEKDAAINEEIDRLRHSATAALRERRDVIIVASVSCIYSMGDPSEYEGQMVLAGSCCAGAGISGSSCCTAAAAAACARSAVQRFQIVRPSAASRHSVPSSRRTVRFFTAALVEAAQPAVAGACPTHSPVF